MMVGGELKTVEQMGQEKRTGEIQNTKIFQFETLRGRCILGDVDLDKILQTV